MTRSRKGLSLVIFCIAVIAIAGLLTNYTASDIAYSETLGPQIDYVIDGTDWTSSKLVTITVTSAVVIDNVLIDGADPSQYLVGEPNNYYKQYEYSATSSDDIIISATDTDYETNIVTIQANELFIDTVIPEFTVSVTGVTDAWTSQNITLTFNQTGTVNSGFTYYYSKDSGEYIQIVGNTVTYDASSDNGTYSYKAISGSGITYNIVTEYDIMIDKTAPNTPSGDFITDYYTDLTVEFNLSLISDELSPEVVYYTTNGTRPTTASPSLTLGLTSIAFPSNGTYAVRLLAIDQVGNEGAVRTYLVKVDDTDYNIQFDVSPIGGGILEGAGIYKRGDIVELTATANNGYLFRDIELGGIVVSYEDTYTFVIDGSGDKTFTANFIKLLEITADTLIFEYDGLEKPLTVEDDSGVELSAFTMILYNGNSTPPTNAGTYSVTVIIDHNDYYGYETFVMTINKTLASITVADPIVDINVVERTYGNVTPINVSVTNPLAGFSLTVLYDGSTSLPVIVGEYPITIIVNSDNYYLEDITYTLRIIKANVSIVLSDRTAIYNGNPIIVNPATTIPGNLIVEYQYYEDELLLPSAPKNVGVYTVKAVFNGNSSYNAGESNIANLAINPKQLTVSGTSIQQVKDYDGNDTSNVLEHGTLAGKIIGDTVSVVATATYNSIYVASADTITVQYELNGIDKDNYIAPVDLILTHSVDGDVQILRRQLEITGTITTTIKVYDGNTEAEVTAGSLTNRVGSDVVNVSASATYNIKDITASSITITYSIEGIDSDNYIAPALEVITGTINPKQLNVTGTDLVQIKIYDGDVSVIVNNDGILDGVVGLEDVGFEVLATYNSKNVWEADTITAIYTLTGTGKGNYLTPVNYIVADGVEGETVRIDKRQLTAQYNASNEKVYDGNNEALSSFTAFDNHIITDDIGAVTTATYNSKNVLDADTITIVFTLTGSDEGNYIKPVDAIEAGLITKLKVTMNAPTYNNPKIYDKNNDATSIVTNNGANNIISPDTVAVDHSAEYNSFSVTEANIITVSYSISGVDSSNYEVPDDYIIYDASILPLQLTVDGTLDVELSRVYDGTSVASVNDAGNLNNVIGLDIVTLSANANYNTKTINANSITVNYIIDGDDKDNYIAPVVEIISSGISITPLALSIEAPTIPASKVYDGNTTASVTPNTLLNKVDGDIVTVSATGVYNSKNVTEATTVAVTYNLTGDDAINYTLAGTSVGATITRRQLVMPNPTHTPKAYDGNNTATSSVAIGSPTNRVSGDAVNVGHTAVYDDYRVNYVAKVTVTYSITGGAQSANYSAPVPYEILGATINKKQLTASGTTAVTTRVYDGTDNTTITNTGTLSGVVTGETVGLSATAKFNSSRVNNANSVIVTYTIDGADAENYSKPINHTISGASISQLQLTIDDPMITLSKVYDSNNTASVTAGSLINKIASDTVNVSAVATYNSANVLGATEITVVYTLSGGHADNYIKPVNKKYYTADGVSITPLPVSLSYSNLSYTYDGLSKTASVQIVDQQPIHSSFNLTLLYQDEDMIFVSPVINSGEYLVSVDMSTNTNFICTDTAYLIIIPAESYMIISNVFATYEPDVSPNIPVTITNNLGDPIGGVSVIITYYSYDGIIPWEEINWTEYSLDDFDWILIESEDPPTRAGVYKVIGSIAEGSNYSAASNEALLKISKAQAEVLVISESLVQPYGSVTGVGILIFPELSEGNPIEYIVYYNSNIELPSDSGTYSVGIIINDFNYYGSGSATFTVTPRQADDDIVIESLNIEIIGDMIEGFTTDYSGAIHTINDFIAFVDVEGLEELIVNIAIKQDDVVINDIINAGSYQIIATIDNINIAGVATATFVINKIQGEVFHIDQSAYYTGAFRYASGAQTNPSGLGISYVYSLDDGETFSSVAPIDIGVYIVKILIDDINYYGEILSSLAITQADTTISITHNIIRTYTGAEINLEGVISYAGQEIEEYNIVYSFEKDGSPIEGVPIDAGIYQMQVSFVDRHNFLYPDSNISIITVNKATPIIQLEDMTYPYDGEPKYITAVIIPSIAAEVIYEYYIALNVEGALVRGDLIESAPINVGTYFVVAYIEDGGDNFTSAISPDAVLVINQGFATITAVQATLSQPYDGEVKEITVTTDPIGLEVELVYSQGGIVVESPTIPGTYTVVATIADSTYIGQNTFILVITKQNISHLITFTGSQEVEYNGASKSLAAYADGHSLDISLTYNDSPTQPKNAGVYTVKATINDNLYSGNSTTQLTINKKMLTITAVERTLAYGSNEVISINYSGFVGGDSTSSLTRPPQIRIRNDATGVNSIGFSKDVVVGTYEAKPENAQADNYTFTYVGAPLTVTRAPLTVYLDPTTVVREGVRATPMIRYTGFKYTDDATSVFGVNRPIVKYYDASDALVALLPTEPGVYNIITDGGISENYALTHTPGSRLIVERNILVTQSEELKLNGSFHPNAVIHIEELNRKANNYKVARKAVRAESSTLLINKAIDMSINRDGNPIFNDKEYEYRVLIPSNIQGKEFVLLYVDSEGRVTKQDYTLDGQYAVGTLISTSGTLVFARPLNVMLILIILGSIAGVIGFIALSKYLKKVRDESPKELSKIVAPVVVAPLEALEDEDAAFDAYIDKMVEESAMLKPEALDEKDEEDIDLGIDESEYTPEEIEKLKEKARKAKYLSVEDKITLEVERQLVESYSETKKDVQLQDYAPGKVDRNDFSDDVEMTDDYIIENELYPNSNVVTMEEAQALYPGRGIRRSNGKVALEVCFESALNLTEDKYKYIYSEIKNSFNSYLGVESRIFKSGEAFKGATANAIIRMRNDIPVIYLNTPNEYIPEDAVYKDRSNEAKYKDMPIEIIVDSGKQLTAARKMISATMLIAGLERNPDYKHVNYIHKYPTIENAILDEA